MAIQIEYMKSFLAQVAGSSGKGPTALTCNGVNRNLQIHKAKVREENNNPQVFVLDSGVRHRPSKRKSTEGPFV